jgi:hypothetical protein
VTLDCAGKAFTYLVKTQAANVKPNLSLKVSGGINTKVNWSETSITATSKNVNLNSNMLQVLRVEEYQGSTLVNENVLMQDTLYWYTSGNSFIFYENPDQNGLVEKHTYKAVIGLDVDGDSEMDATASAPLKITFAKTAPKITVIPNISGTIDAARPGSVVYLSCKVNNWHGGGSIRLLLQKKEGTKTKTVEWEDSPFNKRVENNAYVVSAKDGAKATKEYSVVFCYTPSNTSELYYSKAVALPITKGKVTVKNSASTVELLKEDRFSRGEFKLTIEDPTVARIDHITLDAASAAKFDIYDLGDGTFALGYKGNVLPSAFKPASVKVSVYVEGCAEAVATITLKVVYK